MSNATHSPKMNLEALTDALDGLDAADLADHLTAIHEAAERMTVIDNPDHEVELSQGKTSNEFQAAAADKIDADDHFVFSIVGPNDNVYGLTHDDDGKPYFHQISGNPGRDREAVANEFEAADYSFIDDLCDGELQNYSRRDNENYNSETDDANARYIHEESTVETFAISSIDDVAFDEIADRLDEAREAGLGIEKTLMAQITKLVNA